jgi:glycerol-3-phosphate acyltransferase PlsY
VNDYLILVPVGYIIGSLPFGLVAGWVTKRVDVRDYGSGKTGMTNVMRTVGIPAAAIVLLLDMGKAVLTVVLARIISDSPGVEVAGALAALFGHIFPVFIGFRGGRGTAPGWGGLLILSPIAGAVATGVGLPLAAGTRYVSLGSIMAAIFGPVALVVIVATGHAPAEYLWYAIIGGPAVIVRHRDNILRLLRGQERKLGQSADKTQSPSKPGRGKGFQWTRSA